MSHRLNYEAAALTTQPPRPDKHYQCQFLWNLMIQQKILHILAYSERSSNASSRINCYTANHRATHTPHTSITPIQYLFICLSNIINTFFTLLLNSTAYVSSLKNTKVWRSFRSNTAKFKELEKCIGENEINFRVRVQYSSLFPGVHFIKVFTPALKRRRDYASRLAWGVTLPSAKYMFDSVSQKKFMEARRRGVDWFFFEHYMLAWN